MAENNDLSLGYIMGSQDSNSGNGGDFGFGGGGWGGLLGLIVVASLFGWGGMGGGFGGWGGGAGLQGMATRADINEGFALNNITGGITAIQQGICDSTYALNNAITGGFHGVERGFCDLSHQLSDCCCTTQRAIDGVNYNMATQFATLNNTLCGNTRDIIDNQNCNARAILDALTAQRIADKDERIAEQNQKIFSLELAASQAAQNNYLINQIKPPCPVPAYITCNPYTSAYGFGLNAGCACAG
jgi:hypothetical protein